MKVLGVIVEYNPLHNGHIYHLKKSKEITKAYYIVAVMSGNFTQRGEPAFLPKYIRTKMAIDAGVDLVIELPAVYSVRSARDFAFGGIRLLDATGCVDYVSFGSESGDLDSLTRLANLLLEEPIEVRENIKKYLKEGDSYPKAQIKAWQQYAPKEAELLLKPNNILALEYLKALHILKSEIKPLTITRKKAEYHDMDIKDNLASASAIRSLLDNASSIDDALGKLQKVMLDSSLQDLDFACRNGLGPMHLFNLDKIWMSALKRSKEEEIALYPDVEEGLEKRIYQTAHRTDRLIDLLEEVSTKRYAKGRILRILFYILVQLTKDKMIEYQKNLGPQYIRILGFKASAAPLLKEMRQKASLPIIQKTSKDRKYLSELGKEMLDTEILASELYSLGQSVSSARKDEYLFPYVKNDLR